ncbi:YfcC family protein [Halomonas binhaiensis]|uniref:Basic amino acid antiporter YfcC n=1 Tax=Halomonas binhaiensis TaxID=2562282 RepID=A0A5C1NKG3_9GAMM|nr:Na+/H+ antiporter NhaC family protein [Halomonas binhaiensis]QEM83736.1 putative basic amino acid antiporter YfcC [Halomonas binhaiensis]
MKKTSAMSSATSDAPRRELPHPFVILFFLAIVATVATYLIPSGAYERVVNDQGRSIIVNGTYQMTDSTPIGLLDFFNALFQGMSAGSSIIFYLIIIGGTFGVLRQTRAIEGLVALILRKLAGREILIIPIMMVFFATCSATYGMIEGSIIYIFILLPLVRRAGYDAIVAAAIPLIGTAIGYTGSFLNPFNVGVAQTIAGLPLFSGMSFRILCWVILVSLSAGYVMLYARRVQANPLRSYVHDIVHDTATADADDAPAIAELNRRHLWILAAFAISLAVVIYGSSTLGWYLKEMAGMFFLLGIVTGILGGMKVNDIARAFSNGCKDMMEGALAVGLAYTIVVIVQESQTIDTIIHFLSDIVSGASSTLASLGMFAAQSLMNFIVTSGSGQAALTMPVMVPLADLADVNRQVAVLAFQFGDGISNAFTPTAGWLMAGLAIAGVPWSRWMRFMLPLIVVLYGTCAVLVLIANQFIWPAA